MGLKYAPLGPVQQRLNASPEKFTKERLITTITEMCAVAQPAPGTWPLCQFENLCLCVVLFVLVLML